MKEAMTEVELLAILEQEERDASAYHSSELAKAQAQAMDRFFAQAYGDELPDRSSVCTHDIEDTINWLMPDLMRVFMSSDELVTIEPGSPDDEAPYDPGNPDSQPLTECVADYLDHVFFKDNEGETALYDFAFDGLLQKRGVMRITWTDPEPKPPRLLEGLSAEQVAKYEGDPEYDILEQEEDEKAGTFALKVMHTQRMGRVLVEAVPQEEFAVSRRAKSLPEADYHRRKHSTFLAELIRQHPDRKEELETGRRKEETDDSEDGRVQARHPEESVQGQQSDRGERGRRKVELLEEFTRIDYDGDGIVELRRTTRVGDIILENDAVEWSDYVVWTPMRVAHKITGRSIADVLMDIQKIRTVITRKALDGLSQALTPKTAVNALMVGAEGLDDLTDNEIGGYIRVKGDVRSAIREMVTPDVSGAAFNMLEYWDQRSEEASGVTRHSQGLDPQALNKTATGIDLLQAAAKSRIELIARWLGVGLEEVMQKIMHLIAAHQDGARQVKIKGQWMAIDPRRWSDEMSVKIHVGMSAASRSSQIANLNLIAQKQEQVLVTAGPGNPLVTLGHYRNTLARLCEAMGYKDPARFFGEVPEEMPEQEPQPDPKLIEVQGKMELEKLKAQSDEQLAQAKLASEREIALIKAESEMEIAQLRIRAESEIAVQRMDAEMALARWKASEEIKLRREAGQETNGKDKGSGVRMGGQIG